MQKSIAAASGSGFILRAGRVRTAQVKENGSTWQETGLGGLRERRVGAHCDDGKIKDRVISLDKVFIPLGGFPLVHWIGSVEV